MQEKSQKFNTKNIWNNMPDIDEKDSIKYGDDVANAAVEGINKKKLSARQGV